MWVSHSVYSVNWHKASTEVAKTGRGHIDKIRDLWLDKALKQALTKFERGPKII